MRGVNPLTPELVLRYNSFEIMPSTDSKDAGFIGKLFDDPFLFYDRNISRS